MANYNLAEILDQRGQIDEAIVHYQKAVDADPSSLVVHCCLAAALESRGRIDEADCLTIDKPWKSTLILRWATATSVQSWSVTGSSTRPLPIFRRPWRSTRTRVGATTTWVALARRRRFDEAIAHFQKALEIKPDYAEARTQPASRRPCE